MLIAPTWYRHIDMRAPDRRGGADCCNCTLHDSIVPGHSRLLKSSDSSYTCRKSSTNTDGPTVLALWHAIPGTMLLVGARPPLRHASSWLRGRAYAWTCAAFRFAVMNSGTSRPRPLCRGAHDRDRSTTIAAASSLSRSSFEIVVGSMTASPLAEHPRTLLDPSLLVSLCSPCSNAARPV